MSGYLIENAENPKRIDDSWSYTPWGTRVPQKKTRIKGYMNADGSTQYIEEEETNESLKIQSEETPEQRVAKLEHELWQTNQRLYDAERNLERLANIVQDLQRNLTDEMRYVGYDMVDMKDMILKHTQNFHAMLIIGNKENKDESDIS